MGCRKKQGTLVGFLAVEFPRGCVRRCFVESSPKCECNIPSHCVLQKRGAEIERENPPLPKKPLSVEIRAPNPSLGTHIPPLTAPEARIRTTAARIRASVFVSTNSEPRNQFRASEPGSGSEPVRFRGSGARSVGHVVCEDGRVVKMASV